MILALHLLIAIAAAYALHELGHFLAAEVLGIRTKGFVLCGRGVALVREHGPVFDCLLVSLAGPAFNLLIAAAWGGMGHFVVANLCCGLLQLWPWEGSDGARVLACWDAISVARRARFRPARVDDAQLGQVLEQLAAGPCHVRVSTPAAAEMLTHRVIAAGGDLRRLTVQVFEGVQ